MREGKKMAKAKQEDKVKIHYTGKFEDGTIFDSSVDRDPLEFTIGQAQVISGFETAVVGMNPGEKKTTTIPPEQAYGSLQKGMMLVVERSELPPDLDPKVGQQLKMSRPDGTSMVVLVTEVTEKSVTLDGNHPLAGKTLIFEIELIEIVQ